MPRSDEPLRQHALPVGAQARYPGTCRTCRKDYAPGDALLIVERQPHHATCVRPPEAERPLLRSLRRGFGSKNDEELRLVLGTYEGHAYLGLRVWYRAGAEWRPTKRGLTIKPRELGAVIGALTEAAAALEVDADPPPKAAARHNRSLR